MSQKRDYYEVLGVPSDVDEAALKKAFRRVAMECHPDRNPGDHHAEERFKEASEAYEVLSEPQRRALYDRFGHRGLEGGAGGFGGASVNDIFSEIFGDIFGGERGRGRGADLRYNVDLTFEEAAFGKEIQVKLQRPIPCDICAGTGSKSKRLATCPTCRGTGEVRFTQGFFAVARRCSRCGGAGQTVADPCGTCGGTGRRAATSELNVRIPAGVDTNTQVRVTGEGEAGEQRGHAGDLYVVIRVAEHPLFHREGADLHCEVPISFVQASLGTTLEVPTLEGSERLEVPPGTQSGGLFNLRGRGIPRLQGRGRGDLNIRVVVETPQNLTPALRAVLRDFEAGSGSEIHPRTTKFLDGIGRLSKKAS